jgi:UDP-glucose 4-epimerase
MGAEQSNSANLGISDGQGARNLVKTSTGQYNVDFDAEYAARKLGD